MKSAQRYMEVDPSILRPSPWNVNVVSPDMESRIDESVKRHGMFKPVIVRELPGPDSKGTTLEIIGGEHRWRSAIRGEMPKVPIFNLGPIDDRRAKEISLLDNGRYGHDDTFKLAELLNELGTPGELSGFMPYTESDIASIFSGLSVALDELDISETDSEPTAAPRERTGPTHQVMRFKVPIGDVAVITDLVEKTMKRQGFTDGDSLTNAGDALVHICNTYGIRE